MIGFVMIGTNDLKASSKFYDQVLVPLGLAQAEKNKTYIGYAKKNKPGEIEFYITKPFNKEKATYGNGTQVSFIADSRVSVDSFHSIALKNGGLNEGLPGLRPANSTIYYAYIRDLDGNKICAYSNNL